MIREIPKEERLKIASRHHHHLIDTVSGKIIEFHSRNERVYYMHYKGEKQCKDAGKLPDLYTISTNPIVIVLDDVQITNQKINNF